MATTKSTQRSEDNVHGEKTSMFRRMITKLKNVPAEDDLEVVNEIKPTERVSTEPSLREVKECTTGALQEDLQDLQNVEKRSMFRRMINKLKKGTAEDDLDDGSETNLKPSQRGSTEPSIRELMECTGALRENLQDLQDLFQKKQKYTSLFVRRLQEQTEENHRQENEVLSMIRQLEENTQNRLAQKDQTIWQLKARVTLLKSDKEWEKTEAESKISELEKRLTEQAASTRHRISLKDEEILALKARVLEFEKKGFDEIKTPVRSQTLQGKNVLIDPTSIMQDIQKIREENEKRTARQQEVIRKMRQQMEVNKGFVKQLKQDLTQQIGPQVNEKVLKDIKVKSSEYNPSPQCANERAVEQVTNRSVSTLLVNGCPLLDDDQDNQAKKKEPAAAPPTLLLNDFTLLLDDDQDNQEKKKKPAAAPPTLLLNACPLLLDDDQDNQEKKKKPAAAPPTLLLNGCPLLDDDQHNQEKEEPAAALPTLLLNGCPLLLDDDQHNQAKEEPAAALPTLLLNGCPSLDDDQHNQAKEEPAAALPTLLLNGCPLLDDDQHNQEKEEPAAALPTLLLNGCPLLLDDDQHNQAKEEPAAALPTLLLNGCPLLDADQQNGAKKKEPAAALPTLLLNGCPLQLDDDQHNQAKEEPAAALPTLLLNGCPLLDADQHNGAKKKEPAAALPTLLLNGCPLLLDDDQHNQAKEEPAAALPTLLLNGCPLLDDDQHNQAKEEPAPALPTLLLNGCPLLLDNDQHNQAKEEPTAALPTLLLNGCPLLDADQHNGAKKTKSAAGLPKLYRNGCPLLDTDQHNGAMNGPLAVAPTLVFNGCILQDADQLKETLEEWPTLCISRGFYNPSQASGDSNIKEPPLLPDIELPRFPGFCGVQSFPRSPVEHGDHQHSSVDPAHFLMHPIPLKSFIEHFLLSQRRSASPTEEKECGRGDFYHETSQSASTPEQASSPRGAHSKLNHDAMVLRQSPSIRLRASLESLSTVDVGGGDMQTAPTVAPCRKQEKPHKYREFQQNMSHLDFTALDEPRALEVLIERKVPQQVWTAPDVVRDGTRGLEIALEESATKEHFHSVQYNVLQRCQLNGMFGKASNSNMAAASCQGKSHKTPSAEGDDVTVPHNPASFPLALLTSRIKKGYRLTTGFC
ncbi:uncharacterized protein LOC144873778 isoform X4 [Branchiostoma floridae x Branchiostoma japonicum]